MGRRRSAAGDAFSDALRDVHRLAFIDLRDDTWAVADRVAWSEQELTGEERVPHLARLRASLRPVSSRAQLIHGDLTRDVLFHPTLPPAIIAPSLYWRPPAYASAIVVADALVFEGATAALLESFADVPDFVQCLLRALRFRIVADHVRGGGARDWGLPDPDASAVDLACARADEAR